MLSKSYILSLPFLASLATAFPQALESAKTKRIPAVVPFPEWPGAPYHAEFDQFDAEEQLVSVSGEHVWMAPTAGQIRGPCTGLNAAANHGYLPRSGIATPETVINGLHEAYGLSIDLLTFLQAATMFFDGDPVSGKWSIGYHSDATQSLGAVGNALGNETGICAYGHLKTEGDASITRGDWLAPTMNSNCASYPEFAQGLLDLAKERTGGNITPQVLAEHQYNRKVYSIENNPNYFSPAYAGVAFTFGAHMFAFELLANHSAENPRGFMTPELFETIWSYTRDENGDLVYTYGHERIPENFYRRSMKDQWTLSDVAISTAQQCAAYPTNCQVGGNTGKVNSFTGFDLGDLTGGFINSASDLSDPAKMACFISQAIQADAPSFLDNVFEGPELNEAMALIPTKLIPALAPLGECPNLPAGKSVYAYGQGYPGAKIANSGPRQPY